MPIKTRIKVGDVFGRWTVVQNLGLKANKRQNQLYWLCQCSCGTIKEVRDNSLKMNGSTSCGCLTREVSRRIHTKHGHSTNYTLSLELSSYRAMLQRCTNINYPRYKEWGGRGIKICARWLESFENFLQDMGPRPSKNYTLDRLDNNGDYEPNNCRWATSTEQARNRKPRTKKD